MNDRTLLEQVMAVIGRNYCLDDCAVMALREDYLVATTDMLHETTDFPPGMSEWQMGWMSIAVTLSDIAAMGASPTLLLLATGLDRAERLNDVIKGAHACSRQFGGRLVGGDIDYHRELTLVSTGIGMVGQEYIVRRTGSRPGDCICVTGRLGSAQAALDGYHQFDSNLFEPQPRVLEGGLLGRAGATSMMDISDGLALSLYDLLDANDCGYLIKSEKIPAVQGIPGSAAMEMALYGGGDFELLFTCPPAVLPVSGVPCTVIGEVVHEKGVYLDEARMEKRGYLHQWDK